MLGRLKEFLVDDRAADVAEYAMVGALIILGALVTFTDLGARIAQVVSQIAGAMQFEYEAFPGLHQRYAS